MAINKIQGNILSDNLQRGSNLAFQGNLLYLDVNGNRIGVLTASPTDQLTVNGTTSAGNVRITSAVANGVFYADAGLLATTSANLTFDGANFYALSVSAASIESSGNLEVVGAAQIGNVVLSGNSISSDAGILELGSNANISITGGSNDYFLATDGTGNLYWADPGNVSTLLGNLIAMGTPDAGNLVSNAVTMTANTTVTDGIAQLNVVLGKLVPAAPPAFPGGSTLTIITSTSSGRMCSGFTQTDNTPGSNKAVAAGTVVSVIRGSTYSTSTISNCGPGDSGTLTLYLNGAGAGNVSFNPSASPTANGTYSNLVVSNNYDYNVADPSVAAGFWYVFTGRGTGTVTQGWNEVYLDHSEASSTNTPYWYYDAASPGTPAFSNVTVTACASPSLSYSSTIPHYNSGTQFSFGFSVNRLSGDLYPNNGNLLTNSTTAGGAFQAPASVSYASASVTVPLARNLYVSSGTATGNTTANIVSSGFGSSSTGPSVTVTNSYNSASQAFTTALGNVVLYKNGTTTDIDETDITVTGVGTGSGAAYRIENPGSGNTPGFTGSEAAFNSQTSTLQTYDATVVGSGSQGIIKHDQTNYSTGYLPAGPDLSAGRSGTQYFTLKFVRTNVSKFDIRYTGTVAGMWVALPGSVIDSSSSANGWIDMTQAYAGSGYPGVNAPGNGSDGCSLGGVIQINTSVTNASKTCTFGTVSSSSTATNEIYVRVALTSGQTVTALSLVAATN